MFIPIRNTLHIGKKSHQLLLFLRSERKEVCVPYLQSCSYCGIGLFRSFLCFFSEEKRSFITVMKGNFMSDPTSFYQEAHSGKPTGIKSWLLTTDHKRIGLLYLSSISVWFITPFYSCSAMNPLIEYL